MPPPPALVRTLLEGPSPVASFEWHDAIDSTNRRALELAAAGAPEIAIVAADLQTAGRGRAGRSWTAPSGTSLMLSALVRPPVPPTALPLLPLLAGLVLAEVVERVLPGAEVALKWPNDLLLAAPGAAPRKTAGILVETAAGDPAGALTAVIGMGINVDWRAVERPAELTGTATSLAEVAMDPRIAIAPDGLDRWRLLAALLGVLGNRYRSWCDLPAAFLDGYRARCATLGRDVRAERPGGAVLTGRATDIAASGALVVRTTEGRTVEVGAGDVSFVRPV
jgi:BirA family transcriptional regulator, biotin operon repressor / biotin---[acetyl-CoA-carboxylase] ligase